MLTRIEIDGFKTFRNFALDVSPFLVVIGKNAAGKSNLFDALQLLRAISEGSLQEASQQIRGDFGELFHRHVDGSRVSRMRFAVEVLLEPTVVDAFGDTAEVNHNRLRYEVVVELRRSGAGDRPFVAEETVRLIRPSGDVWAQRFDPVRREKIVRYSRRRAVELLDTRPDEHGRATFFLYQEGNAGRPRLLPAHAATATVLSSLTTATEFPQLYALKRELQSWKLLHLDPTVLRAPSSFDDPDTLAPNGAHVANALRRIVDQTASHDRPSGILADLVADLTTVIPEVVDVRLDEDSGRRQRQVVVVTRDDAPFSARVASDGTLRAIALLVALYDPQAAGLICFEEPENGIYPRRLTQFVAHLRDLVDAKLAQRTADGSTPLTQLLLSSHSPAILRALGTHNESPDTLRDDAVYADIRSLVDAQKHKSRVTRTLRIAVTRQQPLVFDQDEVAGPALIDEFEVLDGLAS